MGRIAGVTAAEVRERLLGAAADVFATRGYDGTRVAEIARAAGVSNAALYAHFTSKAELVVQALRAHGRRMLADAFRPDSARSVTEVLAMAGRCAPARQHAMTALIVEALVAARRHPDVARLMRSHLDELAGWLADLVRSGQLSGEFDGAVAPEAVAHFSLVLAMGSALLPTDLHHVNAQDWGRVLRRVITAVATPGSIEEGGDVG